MVQLVKMQPVPIFVPALAIVLAIAGAVSMKRTATKTSCGKDAKHAQDVGVCARF